MQLEWQLPGSDSFELVPASAFSHDRECWVGTVARTRCGLAFTPQTKNRQFCDVLLRFWSLAELTGRAYRNSGIADSLNRNNLKCKTSSWMPAGQQYIAIDLNGIYSVSSIKIHARNNNEWFHQNLRVGVVNTPGWERMIDPDHYTLCHVEPTVDVAARGGQSPALQRCRWPLGGHREDG